MISRERPSSVWQKCPMPLPGWSWSDLPIRTKVNWPTLKQRITTTRMPYLEETGNIKDS